MSDRDLDAEFARIVAGWDEEAPDPQLRGPLDPRGAQPEVGGPATDDPLDEGMPRLPDASPPRDPEPRRSGGSAEETTDGSTAEERGTPTSGHPAPGKPETPAPTAGAASSGLLELPIAPTTSHLWRGSTRPHDSDDPSRTTGRPAGATAADDAFDDDEHFVPPSDIDLPSAESDPMFWAIVGGLVGGPLLLLYILFFDREGSGWWVVTALAMVVVGFVLLVLRGGTERDPFDDGTRL